MYAVLWLGLVLLAVMLVTIRDFFGGLVVVIGGALLYLVVVTGRPKLRLPLRTASLGSCLFPYQTRA